MLRFPANSNLPQATVEAVNHPTLDPTSRLNVILGELERALLELERARFELDDLPPNSSESTIEAALRKQRNAYRRWYEIQAQATALENEARRRQLESLQLFQKRFQQTHDDLMEHYGDLGPQYRLLVERAASVDAKLAILDSSTRDIPAQEIIELNKLHTSLMNQLQRYTEATKTESLTRQTQETIQSLMIIIEHKVAPGNPQLWREIVHDVRTAVEALSA